MKSMTLAEICEAVGGNLIKGETAKSFDNVSIDSRKIKKGDVFIALRGERHDAHDYLEQAVNAGAGLLIVEYLKRNDDLKVPVIKVNNTIKALQDLARYNRQQFNVQVIGVTGSTGKTTTKDMVASVLGQKYRVLKTEGNFNNELGLPLTLLQLNKTHQVVVLELAMRGPGEIKFLCDIAHPTGAIITNVGEAHLEKLGSVRNIARAKAEILDSIPFNGFAVLNIKSPYLKEEASRCRGKVIYFGVDKGPDIYAVNINKFGKGNKFKAIYGQEEAEFFVPLPGLHNVENAISAIAIGRQLGLSYSEIVAGLSNATISGMRMEIIELNNYIIINDTYNANPTSTIAALHSLQEIAFNRRMVAVLGNMFELGMGSKDGHLRVGKIAALCGVSLLVTVGDLAKHIAVGAEKAGLSSTGIIICKDNEDAIEKLANIILPEDVVLVKGSRGMRMEEIVQGLVEKINAYEV